MDDEFPLTVWRYHLDLPVHGTDRQNLADALEAEDLDLFQDLPREDAARKIRDGRLLYDAAREEPTPAFPADLAALSHYLFEVVRGLEVAERYVSPDVTDDVRAWKVIALRGEWVKIPLVVARDAEGRFIVDLDADDLEVVRARWAGYPRWFQDGMRRKHPSLRNA